jgi:23S rRNA-/tRNA-specific pseudouridylate synthase
VGDKLYAKAEMERSCSIDFTRLALHSHSLELDIAEGQIERFIAPLPQSFEEATEKMVE